MELQDEFVKARRKLVDTYVAGAGVRDERVLFVMRKVPRHMFVPAGEVERAYWDRALPIGKDQTISQPSLVGYMTQALRLTGNEKVLEVGTGSGYQTAILAQLAKYVYSVERIEELAGRARSVLVKLGYDNVRVVVGDGTQGYEKEAPYDAIIVTAAAKNVPVVLEEQLAEGGRLVVPVERKFGRQVLRIGTKADGLMSWESKMEVRFVPLVEGE